MLGENKRFFLQMASRQLQLAEKNNAIHLSGSPRAPSPGLANRVLTHAARRRKIDSFALGAFRLVLAR